LDAGPLPSGDLYHPLLWAYLFVGACLLAATLTVEHTACLTRVRGAALPLATGLAFALEKLLNTELGFLEAPRSLGGVAKTRAWCCLAALMCALGLVDFYLNVRAAARMPLQVFLPVSFALATSLQFFQAMYIFGELKAMLPLDTALSILGATIALVGALMIQPPKFGFLGGPDLVDGDIECALAEKDERLSFVASCKDDGN